MGNGVTMAGGRAMPHTTMGMSRMVTERGSHSLWSPWQPTTCAPPRVPRSGVCEHSDVDACVCRDPHTYGASVFSCARRAMRVSPTDADRRRVAARHIVPGTLAHHCRPARRTGGRRLPQQVEEVLEALVVLEMTPAMFDRAAGLQPSTLRTLDALHLAAALETDLPSLDFITYDARLADAARRHGPGSR